MTGVYWCYICYIMLPYIAYMDPIGSWINPFKVVGSQNRRSLPPPFRCPHMRHLRTSNSQRKTLAACATVLQKSGYSTTCVVLQAFNLDQDTEISSDVTWLTYGTRYEKYLMMSLGWHTQYILLPVWTVCSIRTSRRHSWLRPARFVESCRPIKIQHLPRPRWKRTRPGCLVSKLGKNKQKVTINRSETVYVTYIV